MAKLEEHIPLGEELLWRWPEHPSRFSRIFTFIVLFTGIVAATWIWQEGEFDEKLVNAVVMGVVFGVGPGLLGALTGRNKISEIAITPRWVVLARGNFIKKFEQIEKKGIFRATLWEKKGRLILHRRRAKSLELESLPKTDELIEAMSLPVRVWPKREAEGTAKGIARFALLQMMLIWIGGMFVSARMMAFYDVSDWIPEGWVGAVTIGGVILVIFPLMLIPAALLAGFIGVLLGRVGGREVLEDLIRSLGDPAWDGERKKPGIDFKFFNLLARLTGARPVAPDRLEPNIRSGPLPKFHTGKRWRP